MGKKHSFKLLLHSLKLLHSLVLSVNKNKNIFSNTIGVTSMCWITVNTTATLIINSM